MTPAEIKTLINEQLPTNGNYEITAAILRPVLTAMVDQINDLVGNEDNLPDGSTTVIEAINNLDVTGVQVYTGTANPNDTPPSSFNVGDFYSQTLSSVIIAFWQNNGIEWVEVLNRNQQKLRNVQIVTESYIATSSDDVIIYNGVSINDVITLTSALTSENKIFVISNISDYDIEISVYKNLFNQTVGTIYSNSVLKLICKNRAWHQINNDNDLSTGS